MKKLAIILSLISMLTSCTDEDNAMRILKNEGFTNIQLTGYSCFKCSKNDETSTGFTAINLAGKIVSGTVCGGYGKGYTIRYN